MPPVIQVEHLTKHYRLGIIGTGTLNEDLHRWWHQLRGRPDPLARIQPAASVGRSRKSPTDLLWALRDLSFTVNQGEVLGIIGRNGAGKSTLLKILSRVTAPTAGSVKVKGRIASLLEVGTGFHPELTGRDNVFLNGAILGMTKAEIARRFDEIVAFSEVEKFIDTPVKRYSSGMYVRLAFAVAAHLDPNILLVDEVLAVGDLAFQRKCMDHMTRLAKRGVTILFVSHSMFAVRAMCSRSVCLSGGQVEFDGSSQEAVQFYENRAGLHAAEWARAQIGTDPAQWPIRVMKAQTLDENGTVKSVFEFGERIRVRVHYLATQLLTDVNFCVGFHRSDNIHACSFSSTRDGLEAAKVTGEGFVDLLTPPLRLVADTYMLHFAIWDKAFHNLHAAQSAGLFHIRHTMINPHFGVVHERGQWDYHPGEIPPKESV